MPEQKVDEKNVHFLEEEMSALRQEIEHFQQEKDRVRAIVGQIGGVPTQNTKVYNIVFVLFIIVCLFISLRSEGKVQLLMIELAIGALSVKLIYLIHFQSRINHFQLWILSSIEWQLNEIIRKFGRMEKKIDSQMDSKGEVSQ